MTDLSLGLIGNCSIGALVDRKGDIVWACLPRFDGDPVLNALLGGDGVVSVGLENLQETEQHYVGNSAVLRTVLRDAKGNALEIVDTVPRFPSRGRMFRPQSIVRRITPIEGIPRITLTVRPRFKFNEDAPTITHASNNIRYVHESLSIRLTTDAPITYLLDETPFQLDRSLHLILGPDETLAGGIEDTAAAFERDTLQYWHDWCRRLALPLEWQQPSVRAAIALKLCVFEETGAIIAAMTTSIPEAANSGRNWDYRFCWLRDSFFVVRALNSLSAVGTMEHYLRWLNNVVSQADGGHLQPVFGIGQEQALTEWQAAHLPGYRGMGPVRIGNQAHEHFQFDAYGNVILAASQAFFDTRLYRPAGLRQFAELERVGERAYAIYDQPDAGMWELRTRARVHTSSALMSWAACDRLAKIAYHLGAGERHLYWRRRADEIRAKILDGAWSEERQAFAESFGGRDLDASVLLMAEVGMIDPRDPRFVSTVERVEEVLGDGVFTYRYEAPDDFGRPETGFNICTFWRIDALARIGQQERARALFESMLAYRNHLGLLSEDLDPANGELWGNFPQTYSMVGIINGAQRLSKPWDSVV